jgi:hypothetical protein
MKSRLALRKKPPAQREFGEEKWRFGKFFEKKWRSELTSPHSELISPSRWKRGLHQSEDSEAGSRIFWDCKLELNFVPA